MTSFEKQINNFIYAYSRSCFCERLFLCDFNGGIYAVKGGGVVQTFNITTLFDRAAYRVWDFGNPAKIQGRTQKYHVPVPLKWQA